MREIKFRAWDKDNKKWIERFYISGESGDVFDVVFGGWRHLGEDIELIEYTGLKDKNGKEIYEGDIIKSSFRLPGKGIYKVEWVQKNAEFTIQEKSVCEDCVEIIGNIYENPKLLEGKEDEMQNL